MKEYNKIKGISMFSSGGIAETYLEDIGIEILLANELIVERANFYKYLYPKSKMITGDIQNKNIFNEFIVYPFKKSIQLGSDFSVEPKLYGFDFYGLKQDEKVFNTDIRKVGVIIKQDYTTSKILPKIDASYRVYVREGQIEVQVQDWTKINRTTNEYYFIFDTRDKIPNEYYIDIKVKNSGEVNTYKRQIKFQIVSYK